MMSLRDDLRAVARGWRWTHRPLVPRSAEPFELERQRREFPTTWARSRFGRALRGFIQRFGLKPLVWSEISPRIEGLDHLDTVEGPVLFVANHASHIDAPLILTSLPPAWRDRTAVAAAADYFFDDWWRAVGSALVFNTFPIERGGGQVGATPADLLEEGWSLVVFPEGTRSPDGWVQRFRRGAAYLAVTEGIPVVPVAIRGSYAAMPRGRGWPLPGRPPVSIRYGPPVVPAPDEHWRDFSARLYQEVARLLDEDQTTWWESLRRAQRGETPSPAGPPVARWRRVWEASESPPRVPARRRVWSR